MSRSRLRITPHLSVSDLTQHYQTCHDDHIKTYWHVILLLSQSNPYLSVEAVASTVYLSPDWVRKLARRYNHFGAAGITGEYAKHSTSRSRFSSPAQPCPTPRRV